jgi:hypothetical protein
MKTKFLLCLPVVYALLCLPILSAQTTKQITINATVPEMMSLTVDVTTVTFAFLVADYDAVTGLATKEVLKGTTFSVSANRAWKLTAKAGSAAFTFTPSGTAADPIKPSSSLALRTGTAAYAPFSGVAILPVATGASGGYAKAGNVIPVDYQMKSDLNLDSPGAYLLTITYTLAAQ